MKNYEEMKNMLGGDVVGFTKEFYETFVKEYRMNLIRMIQPGAFADSEPYENSKKFRFYDSAEFYRFSEIFNSTRNLNKYKFIYKKENGEVLNHMYHLAENEYAANEIAKLMIQYGGSENYELKRVA